MTAPSIPEAPNRTAEFLLVRSIRQSVNAIAPRISEATQKDYTAKYIRMRRTGFLPEHAGTKRAFYAYRAAMLYGTAQCAREALKVRDKAPYGSDAWEAAMRDLEVFARVFARYPPDPERRHYATGSASFTWNAVKQHKIALSGEKPQGRSKKRVLSKLRRIPDWRLKLFQCASVQYRDCLAVLAVTGARPSELAQGITVELKQDASGLAYLIVTIKGTKLTPTTGQPSRTLCVRVSGAIAQHLAARVRAQDSGILTVAAKPANLTAAVIKAGRKAFPTLAETVTPYVLRHAIASDAKGQSEDFSPIVLAQMLGHQATETQQYYGYAACASGASQIVAVKASAPVRVTHRRPANAIALAQSQSQSSTPSHASQPRL